MTVPQQCWDSTVAAQFLHYYPDWVSHCPVFGSKSQNTQLGLGEGKQVLVGKLLVQVGALRLDVEKVAVPMPAWGAVKLQMGPTTGLAYVHLVVEKRKCHCARNPAVVATERMVGSKQVGVGRAPKGLSMRSPRQGKVPLLTDRHIAGALLQAAMVVSSQIPSLRKVMQE